MPEKIIGAVAFPLIFFDRCANNALLHRPQDACGVVASGTRRSQVRKFYLISKKKHPPHGECFFLVDFL